MALPRDLDERQRVPGVERQPLRPDLARQKPQPAELGQDDERLEEQPRAPKPLPPCPRAEREQELRDGRVDRGVVGRVERLQRHRRLEASGDVLAGRLRVRVPTLLHLHGAVPDVAVAVVRERRRQRQEAYAQPERHADQEPGRRPHDASRPERDRHAQQGHDHEREAPPTPASGVLAVHDSARATRRRTARGATRLTTRRCAR